jgi:hypothetical protein
MCEVDASEQVVEMWSAVLGGGTEAYRMETGMDLDWAWPFGGGSGRWRGTWRRGAAGSGDQGLVSTRGPPGTQVAHLKCSQCRQQSARSSPPVAGTRRGRRVWSDLGKGDWGRIVGPFIAWAA